MSSYSRSDFPYNQTLPMHTKRVFISGYRIIVLEVFSSRTLCRITCMWTVSGRIGGGGGGFVMWWVGICLEIWWAIAFSGLIRMLTWLFQLFRCGSCVGQGGWVTGVSCFGISLNIFSLFLISKLSTRHKAALHSI